MAEATSEKLKVFISYSRKDSTAFVDELVVGLEDRGFAPFLDRHDISPGEPWEARLGGLIAQADTTVFVVSPEAVRSERCGWEIEKTLALSKRLLPVVYKPVPEPDIPAQLRALQFVRFDTAPGIMRPLRELADALRTDLDWVREHTRLGEMAVRWSARGRPDSLLLRSEELTAAKAWAAADKVAGPGITEEQRAFIAASEDAEALRLGNERAQLDAMARAQAATALQQKRAGRLLWAIGALVMAMVGYAVWKDYDLARREINVFVARATEAMNDQQFDRAMRYALQAYPARGHLSWLTPFSTELEGKLAGGAQLTRLRRILTGHTGKVSSAAFSPDGKRVVTASSDTSARLWDAESGSEIAVLTGHTREVWHAGFSPDGRSVVTVSFDNSARLWDAEDGRQIAVLRGHTGAVWSADFSPDGRRVVTASADNSVRLWDAGSSRELAVLRGHTGAVRSAAFSPDGRRVVTASEDFSVRLWDAEGRREIAVLRGHTDWVLSATFSPDGRRVVTASFDTSARLWDAETGREIAVFRGHTGTVQNAVFSPDGRRVATVSSDTSARLWDAQGGREIAVLRGHISAVRGAAFSPDGRRVVTAADDSARLWDAEGGREIAALRGHTAPVASAAFSPDGRRVVTASFDNSARLWNTESGREIAVLRGHTAAVPSAAFSPNGRRVVTASWDNSVRLWDVEGGREIAVLRGHTSSR